MKTKLFLAAILIIVLSAASFAQDKAFDRMEIQSAKPDSAKVEQDSTVIKFNARVKYVQSLIEQRYIQIMFNDPTIAKRADDLAATDPKINELRGMLNALNILLSEYKGQSK